MLNKPKCEMDFRDTMSALLHIPAISLMAGDRELEKINQCMSLRSEIS